MTDSVPLSFAPESYLAPSSPAPPVPTAHPVAPTASRAMTPAAVHRVERMIASSTREKWAVEGR